MRPLQKSVRWLLCGVAAALATGVGAASASPTVTIDGAFNENTTTGPAPFVLLPLGSNQNANTLVTTSSFSVDGDTISFSGGSPASGEYAGNKADQFASPFGGSNNKSDYLVAGGSNGDVKIVFPALRTSFSLLWGTVDSGSGRNLITFFNGSTPVFSIDGDTILADAHVTNQAGEDNIYVSIAGIPAFTSAIFSDNGDPSFEFVPDPQTRVPEPKSSWLFVAGFLSLLAVRSKKSLRPAPRVCG